MVPPAVAVAIKKRGLFGYCARRSPQPASRQGVILIGKRGRAEALKFPRAGFRLLGFPFTTWLFSAVQLFALSRFAFFSTLHVPFMRFHKYTLSATTTSSSIHAIFLVETRADRRADPRRLPPQFGVGSDGILWAAPVEAERVRPAISTRRLRGEIRNGLRIFSRTLGPEAREDPNFTVETPGAMCKSRSRTAANSSPSRWLVSSPRKNSRRRRATRSAQRKNKNPRSRVHLQRRDHRQPALLIPLPEISPALALQYARTSSAPEFSAENQRAVLKSVIGKISRSKSGSRRRLHARLGSSSSASAAVAHRSGSSTAA